MELGLSISEFFGTFIYVYLGQSATASFELIGTQNDMLAKQFATIFSYGLSYLFASLLILNISGAYINPAYTIASAAFGKINWTRAIRFSVAQYLGAFFAATILHSTYLDKISHRHMEAMLMGANATLRAHGSVLSTGKLFTSYPPTEVSLSQLFISYITASTILALLVETTYEAKLAKISRSLKPFYLGASMSLVLASFSANGGPVLNPAQDFSPRLYIAIFGWGCSAFNLYNYRYWWLCCLMAPHVGALLGVSLHKILMCAKGLSARGQ